MQVTTAGYKAMANGNDLFVVDQVLLLAPTQRTNLCPNPKGNTAFGWTASNPGTQYQPFTQLAGIWVQWANSGSTQSATQPIATRAGETYTVQIQMAPVPGGTITGGVAIGALGIGQGTPGSGGGIAWFTYTFVATGNLTYVGLFTQGASSGSSLSIVTDFFVEEAASAGSYFNGNTPGASWTGIAGQSTSILKGVTAAQDFTATLESIQITRQISTNMPEGSRLTTGYPTASAIIKLSGLYNPLDANQTAAWYFDPWNTASPFYGDNANSWFVQINQGFAWQTANVPEILRTFTGIVDRIDYDPITGTITINCLDYRNTLRVSPVLPAVASQYFVPAGSPASLLNGSPGLTSAWVLDSLLRANGYYTSPPPFGFCIYYASNVGSAFPQIYDTSGSPVFASTLGDYTDQAGITDPSMTFVDGFWNRGICRDISVIAPMNGVVQTVTGGGCWTEWWMDCILPPTSAFIGGSYPAAAIQFAQTDGAGNLLQSVQVRFQPLGGTSWQVTDAAGGTHTITLSSAEHQMGVILDWSGTPGGTVRTRLYVDNSLIGTWSGTNPLTGTPNLDTISYFSPYPIEALQVTFDYWEFGPTTGFTPNAYLDASLNGLFATVDISNQDPWQVIQQITDAEQGMAGFDELGVFRFHNRITLRSGTSVRTVTSSKSLKTLAAAIANAQVANHVTAPVNSLGLSKYQAVWNTSQSLYVGPNSTLSLIANTQYPVAGAATSCVVIPSGGITPTQPVSGYRAARNPDGSGGQVSNLTMSINQITPTQFQITVFNPNGYRAYLVSPSGAGFPTASNGQPCLAIGGQFVQTTSISIDTSVAASAGIVADSQWPPVSEGGARANVMGEIVLNLNSNPWLQTLDSAQLLTDDTLGDLYKPRALLTGVDVIADPSLQLPDRVTINDTDASYLNDDVLIMGIVFTSSASDWTQKLTVRLISTPGGWIMGQVGRSEMGIATFV